MTKLDHDEASGIAPGTVIDGRYKIVRAIGQGGNGLIHEVVHVLTGRHLALKSLLDESGLARLEQEARASALMKNGHTAKITDMGSDGPAGPYLVMELLEGQSLRDLLDEAGQLPLELTVNMALQVCECLSEAHGIGIIHRDLKPTNVFLCASPWPGQYDVKVLDFGIVKIASDVPIPQSSLTRTGSTVGTPYYMSLEQLRNSSAVDPRADIYSLGVVLYECLSGRKPFLANTIGDLVFALCSGPPAHLGRLRPDLPIDLCEVVMRTLSANREERPATMADLAKTLLHHGNPAFGLWLRAFGRSTPPAAQAPPPPQSLALGSTPNPASTSAPVAQRSPMLATTSAEAAASADAIRAPPASRGKQAKGPTSALFPDMPHVDEEDNADRTVQQLGRFPLISEPSSRDTPTEMYVKSAPSLPAHEIPVDFSPAEPDTPTKALRDPGSTQRERPFLDLDTLQSDYSPAKISDVRATPFNVSAPFQARVTQPSSTTWNRPPDSNVSPPRPAAPRVPSSLFSGGLFAPSEFEQSTNEELITAKLPSISDVNPPVPRARTEPPHALSPVGSFFRDAARKFRSAPQRTQLLLTASVGSMTVVVVGLLLMWIFRR
jgi:serine/threonine-protein kinase